MNKTVKYILIAVAVLVVLGLIIWGIIYFSGKNNPVATPTQGGPTPPNTGNAITDILAGLLGGGFWQNLFGNKPGSAAYCAKHPEDVTNCNAQGDCYNGCKSSMPGYDCAGNPSSYC